MRRGKNLLNHDQEIKAWVRSGFGDDPLSEGDILIRSQGEMTSLLRAQCPVVARFQALPWADRVVSGFWIQCCALKPIE